MTRGPLLKALLSLLPQDILHAGKKLTSIVQADDVEITFEDGTIAHFDAVIGADGLFSTVRKHVLQGAEEHGASPVGGWECRNLVPLEKAKAVLGDASFEVDREYCWAGDGGFMMHALVENGTMVQCIVTAHEKDFPRDRKRPVTRDVLESAVGNSWFEGPVARGMIDVSGCSCVSCILSGLETNGAYSSCSTKTVQSDTLFGSTSLRRRTRTAECVSSEMQLTRRVLTRVPEEAWLLRTLWSSGIC
jgi:hypothetical protein